VALVVHHARQEARNRLIVPGHRDSHRAAPAGQEHNPAWEQGAGGAEQYEDLAVISAMKREKRISFLLTE
jgi:hypothetical protein